MHNDVILIALLQLDSSMHLWRCCTTNEHGNVQALLLELFAVENHLIEWWRDQSWKTDNVCFFTFTRIDDGLAALHNAHINDFVVVAAEYDANNVLTDVMNIAFDGSKYNCTIVLHFIATITARFLLSLHKRGQIIYCFLHDASWLDDLW